MINNIKELLKERDDEFNAKTAEIIGVIPHVVEGLYEFVKAKDGPDVEVNVRDVELFEAPAPGESSTGEEREDIVLLMGVIDYTLGSTLKLPSGVSVVVNEETQEYLRRILRVGFPYPQIVEWDKDEIVNYLNETEVNNGEEDPMKLQDHAPSTVDQDFNLDDLTEEQRKSLMMFTKMSGG